MLLPALFCQSLGPYLISLLHDGRCCQRIWLPLASYTLQPFSAESQTTKQLHVLPGKAEVEQKGSKLKQHVVVKSRVKEQLQQAQSLHQQRGKVRQQRLQAALGPRYASVPC